MSIHADEINLLVRRYLQETGFFHTAYVFGNECLLDEAKWQANQLPPQALVSILKKGMLYMQMEKGINEKAKTGIPADIIISSLVETVRNEEPIVPVKEHPQVLPRPQQNPVPQNPPPPPKPTPHSKRPIIHQSLPTITNPTIIDKHQVHILGGHTKDVYCGAWTKDGHHLATGSGDAMALIWKIQNDSFQLEHQLDHATPKKRDGKDIATLEWNPEGTLLATGCYDGSARLWKIDGELKNVLECHTEPVFTVKFSPDGSLLLTGGADQIVVVWDVQTGEQRQVFHIHQSRVLDVDWLNNQQFASCSGDTRIAVSQIGKTHTIFLEGHSGEVNKIEWDPDGRYLASCSDDKTVRVWRPFENSMPFVLHGHTHHVYTIKWCPNHKKLLASGAFDYTVRIWDVQSQSCLFVLSKHSQPIYTICFSPKGNFFVSGGIDSVMNMFRTDDAALVASFNAESGIFEAVWDPTGKNIALCLADSRVLLIPTQNVPYYQE